MKLAEFSPCRRYRYTLWREWICGSGYAQFICLNPSTATDTEDDPTVRRCINFSKSWGYAGFCMTNLFAYRSTQPDYMKAADDPIGNENDLHLINVARDAAVIVAAWGTHGSFMNRDVHVINLIKNLHYLRLTQGGHPQHPLYLPSTLKPLPL